MESKRGYFSNVDSRYIDGCEKYRQHAFTKLILVYREHLKHIVLIVSTLGHKMEFLTAHLAVNFQRRYERFANIYTLPIVILSSKNHLVMYLL